MRRLPAIAPLVFFAVVFPFLALAQEPPSWVIRGLSEVIPGAPEGKMDYDFKSEIGYGTNIFIQYGTNLVQSGGVTLMAQNVRLNRQTGEVVADGHVRIEDGDQVWVGEHIRYNFLTHQMQSEQFRTGKPPAYAQGEQLEGDTTNQTYHARHALVTTDDVSNPAIYVRSSHIKIVPGQYVEMWNAVVYMDGVPALYFP